MGVPDLKLSNGKTMPIIGLGTWKSKPGEVKAAVINAIEIGYRHIDCAIVYENENEIGEALKEVFASGKVKREDLFITSKCWNTYHKRERVMECCKKSLSLLNLDYLDLYLIHWPFAFKDGDNKFPRDSDENIITEETDFLDTWKGMEDVYNAGLVKSIGLSNFNHEQINRVIKEATVKPAALQVECHPYLNQNKLIEFCGQNGIVVTAYSPLGSPDRPMGKPADPVLMSDPKVKEIAAKHNKSEAQVLIKYQIQRGVSVIPKSVNKERIASNFNVFDFELTKEDLETLNSFSKFRYVGLQWIKGHPFYPFDLEY